ncbi:RecX family transcriptional regulator [Candidatus Saccharibacteria bacterium]|nr:RecX family transcriptional regulator [Candidatus Saccharibacteria bacterium]
MALEIATIFDNPNDLTPKAKERIVTDIKEAVRDRDRLNVYIDRKFFCSLALSQVVDLKLKIGKQLNDEDLKSLRRASEFGKLYQRALEYALLRPHSQKEMRDYLKKKTLNKAVRVKNQKTGEYQTKQKEGFDASLVEPVLARLVERGYVDDERFAKLWIENRSTRKGISQKKLRLELQSKGISQDIIDTCLSEGARDERKELKKVIAKKAKKYPDEQKLIQYLLRQGFNYSDVLEALSTVSSSE